MSINSSKCETVSFGIDQPQGLKLDIIIIPDEPHCKHLGVHLDPQLNICKIISYVAKNIGQFLRTDVQSQVYLAEEMS